MKTPTSTTEAKRLIARVEKMFAEWGEHNDIRANSEMAQLAQKLAHLLRASEEARVKAEREGDQLRASYAEMNKLSAAAHHEWALAEERAEAAETALADMRRERDEAEFALLSVFAEVTGNASLFDTRLEQAITAARSRAKLDGEEKKL